MHITPRQLDGLFFALVAVVSVILFSLAHMRLPDLVILPAQELRLTRSEGGEILLQFSTTYYNQGKGPLELLADIKESQNLEGKGIYPVSQRVYLPYTGHIGSPVGILEWDQKHSHYHFENFVTYTLEKVSSSGDTHVLEAQKTTFCLRDVNRVRLNNSLQTQKAAYKTCNKVRQGVSVGWGDSYYYDFPGQSIDVTSLPSGTYRLTQEVDPERNLQESNYDNNVSNTLLIIDKEHMSVDVLEENPAEVPVPEIEYVHLENPFDIGDE